MSPSKAELPEAVFSKRALEAEGVQRIDTNYGVNSGRGRGWAC